MRGSKGAAMAVRLPVGKNSTPIRKALGGHLYEQDWKDFHFCAGLVSALVPSDLVMRFLTMSAKRPNPARASKVEGPVMYLTLGFSLLLAVGIFFLAPAAFRPAC